MSILSILQHPRARRWLVCIWGVELLVTAYVSLLPASRIGNLGGSDKLWHGGTYLLLALPVCFLFFPKRQAATATGALILYGTLLEVGQLFVPGRSFEWGDILANSVGSVLGFLLSRFVLRIASADPSAELTATRRP